ncbi:MAG: DUF2784 domain-containing protein [Thermoanaerobaculia bacterium]
MLVSLAADLVASLHFAFVVFVVSGGLLVLRWPRLAWLHLPAVAWGASIELLGWICPLTPLENRLRHEAGLAGYEGGFVEHYLLPLLYPASLSRSVQVILGLSVLLINAVLYGSILRRRFRHPL